MPLYEFCCEGCGALTEVLQKYTDAAPGCASCAQPMKRKMSVTSFTLKGDGWARDSYGAHDITYGANGGGRGIANPTPPPQGWQRDV